VLPESCTRGGLGAAPGRVQGPSNVFLGGVISYSKRISRLMEVSRREPCGIWSCGATSGAGDGTGVRRGWASDWA